MAETNPRYIPKCQRWINKELVALEMTECEDEIIAAETVIIELKHKRMALKTKMNSYSDPMAQLPPDISTKIFSLVINTQTSDSDEIYTLPAPFLLGKICTAWRRIVWNQPSLWKTIRIRLSRDAYPTQKQLLHEWLHRSRNCLLSFDITCRDDWQPPASFAIMILNHAKRWQSFKSTRMLKSLHEAMVEQPLLSFPKLTSLDIIGSGPKGMRYRFCTAPRLRHLHIGGPEISIVAPFSHLEDVTIKSSVEVVVLAAKYLKNVRALSLHLTVSATDPELPDPIRLRSLSSLSINGCDTEVIEVLLTLRVPKLSKLELFFSQVPRVYKVWREVVQDTLTCCSSNLTTLTIRNIDLPEEHALPLWTNLPLLTSLSLQYHPFGSSGLSDLTITCLATPGDDGSACLLPSLTHLDYKGKITFCSNTMIKTLEKRLILSKQNPGIKCLQTINITYSNNQWAFSGDHKNPNHLQTFYRNVMDLASRGIKLNIAWDEKFDS